MIAPIVYISPSGGADAGLCIVYSIAPIMMIVYFCTTRRSGGARGLTHN